MLYLVPTPIGNLDDITVRTLKLFEQADVVLTEDGRQTSKLFQQLGIQNKPKFINLTKNHRFNRPAVEKALSSSRANTDSPLLPLTRGKNSDEEIVLLLTDSGTPGISDPAFETIQLAQELDAPYSTLPGPTALIPAVVNSGLISKEFHFLGFLPIKNGRQKTWQRVATSTIPTVIYESVHRLEKFLKEAKEHLEPDRKISYSREISKLHEEVWTGTVTELSQKEITPKGEFVWVIGKC